jgi:hypothetical protein
LTLRPRLYRNLLLAGADEHNRREEEAYAKTGLGAVPL